MSATRPVLFKLSGEKIGAGLELELKVLSWLQRGWVRLSMVLEPFLAWLFSLRGVSYYVVLRSEKGYQKADELLEHVKEILRTAKEVHMAVGEMEYGLMERTELIEGFRRAYQENQATIEIVHGPRVDLQTKSIFDFARNDTVKLFMMPKYRRHHFFHVNNLTNHVSIIDEAVHTETLWAKNQSGKLMPIFSGTARFYYVVEHSKRLAASRRREYERRKSSAERIYEHPRFSTPQDYSHIRILATALLEIPINHVLQAVSILFDLPLELSPMSVYKESRRDKARKNGSEFGAEKKSIRTTNNTDHLTVSERDRKEVSTSNKEQIPIRRQELLDEQSPVEEDASYGKRKPPHVPLTREIIEEFIKIDSVKKILLESLEKREKRLEQNP